MAASTAAGEPGMQGSRYCRSYNYYYNSSRHWRSEGRHIHHRLRRRRDAVDAAVDDALPLSSSPFSSCVRGSRAAPLPMVQDQLDCGRWRAPLQRRQAASQAASRPALRCAAPRAGRTACPRAAARHRRQRAVPPRTASCPPAGAAAFHTAEAARLCV